MTHFLERNFTEINQPINLQNTFKGALPVLIPTITHLIDHTFLTVFENTNASQMTEAFYGHKDDETLL